MWLFAPPPPPIKVGISPLIRTIGAFFIHTESKFSLLQIVPTGNTRASAKSQFISMDRIRPEWVGISLRVL